MTKLILASTSPRRKEFLERVMGKGSFSVEKSSYKEPKKDMAPEALAIYHAVKKAEGVAARHYGENVIVIAADTIVVLDKEILGKPKNANDAKKMLKKLSGKKHVVITGISVLDCMAWHGYAEYEETAVYFKDLTDKEIAAYVKTKEPMDKSGSYGIQEKGALFVRRIEGDYFSVAGLPLYRLNTLLERLGVSLFMRS